MSKTIKESLETLFLGLGGNASALSDNTDTSDVIDDLESAIKGCVGGIINDTASSSTKTYSSSKIEELTSSVIDDDTASSTKTYSSSKIESLIPEAELPTVTADDNGKILAVVDGAWTKVTMTAVADTTTGTVTFTLTPDAPAQDEET